ncbi:hypothetical protein SAMN05877753_107191 [Bacillus oleivorans]|uniref:Uncharacterized protein n=1 Tax=Bacillus oleivorans TaxID=1448271 RepID=A0A285D1Q1_9BACI|nr:hypothetical protein SAMN05877753_107191 [Bacillus oleivorans]
MTLLDMKSIDLQIAIPRTQDLGKLQSEAMQRNLVQHDVNNELIHKEDRQKQQTVVKQEQKGSVQNQKKESSSQDQNQHPKKQKSNNQKEKSQMKHPYKGKIIDYSS